MQFRISFSSAVLRIIVVCFVGVYSCKGDKNKYSPVPFLELKGAYVFNNGNGNDSFILIQLFYRDGDGDIGLNPGDTAYPFGPSDPYFYNLQVWMWQKSNGVWFKPVNPLSPTKDTVNFHERIKSITPTGRVKWIQGNLNLRIPAAPFSLKPDTIKIEMRIFDRKLNSSSKVLTDQIILQH